MNIRHLALLGALSIAVPEAALAAAPQWGRDPRAPQVVRTAAYSEGVLRGQRAGEDDARRGDRFNFADEGDYRRADAGYRAQYGSRDPYRDEFRRGFEVGYRSGYARVDRARGGYGDWTEYPGNDGRYNDRGTWTGRAVARTDSAWVQGFDDGYEEGRKDGRDRHRLDPVAESRYRSADRGYNSHYGPKEVYKEVYREAFRDGYLRGYEEFRGN